MKPNLSFDTGKISSRTDYIYDVNKIKYHILFSKLTPFNINEL